MGEGGKVMACLSLRRLQTCVEVMKVTRKMRFCKRNVILLRIRTNPLSINHAVHVHRTL